MNRRLLMITAAAVVLGLVVDALVGYSTLGYPSAVGLAGGVAVIVVSRFLGKVWLRRPLDYYERERERVGGDEGPSDA